MPCVNVSHISTLMAMAKKYYRPLSDTDLAVHAPSAATSAPAEHTATVDSNNNAPVAPHTSVSVARAFIDRGRHATKITRRIITARRRNTHPSRSTLINAESRLGSQIFGPIPDGHRREFFHDRENIWIWHEEWTDHIQHHHRITVRYEVRTTGVFKKISAGSYFRLEGDELENFRRAAHAYLRTIKTQLYHLPTA